MKRLLCFVHISLEFPFKGDDDLHNIYIDSYKWQIPAGWKIDGVVSVGTTLYEGLENKITVTTDNTTAGTITVWGHSDCGTGYDSEPSSINVTRSFPNINITVTTDNEYLQGDLAPFTFSLPDWDFAAYSWNLPSGWILQGGNTSY